MRRFLKTGLLLLLLVVPVSFFLFLKIFGENYFDLPYLHPVRDPVNGAIVMAGKDTSYYRVPPLQLSSENMLRAGDMDNRFTLVYAPMDVCSDSVKVAFNYLKRYWSSHGKEFDALQFWLLTEQQADSVSACLLTHGVSIPFRVLSEDAFSVSSALADLKFNERPGRKQTFSRFHRLILVDSKRYIRGYYDLDGEKEAERLTAELRILQQNFNQIKNL